MYREFFLTGTLPKNLKYKKVNLGKVRCIYVNVDSPNLGFPYLNPVSGALAWKIELEKIDFNEESEQDWYTSLFERTNHGQNLY